MGLNHESGISAAKLNHPRISLFLVTVLGIENGHVIHMLEFFTKTFQYNERREAKLCYRNSGAVLSAMCTQSFKFQVPTLGFPKPFLASVLITTVF